MICCTLVRISRKSRPSSRGTVGGGRLGRKPQHKTHDASSASEKRLRGWARAQSSNQLGQSRWEM
eukprot:5215592-Prymnesium_polylepis.1